MNRFERWLRLHLVRNLPSPLYKMLYSLKSYYWNVTHSYNRDLPLEDQFPWSSPDIWQRVVDFYTARISPTIFEYGMGSSSIHHIKNLMGLGGTYIAVENDPVWYTRVCQAIIRYGILHSFTISCNGMMASENTNMVDYDLFLRLEDSNLGRCTIYLKFRPISSNVTKNQEGDSLEREYVESLDESCDVVIVDGKARKACVNYVLDRALLRGGGLLALFEAGRGRDDWFEAPNLEGEMNYQDVVTRMLDLGGELVDGKGLDNWPNLKYRRTRAPNAFSYPMEACFLRLLKSKSDENKL